MPKQGLAFDNFAGPRRLLTIKSIKFMLELLVIIKGRPRTHWSMEDLCFFLDDTGAKR